MKPLAGLLVLDLTRLLPGPYAAWLLRSWGARVVKVEDLQAGDYLREAQPVWFEQLNGGAESLALDLKQPAGRALFLRLIPRADMVLEGFRPGVLDRLGLGYETLRAANPRLVLLSVGGYDGEVAGRAGHDINYLARSGLLSLMGELPPIQLADLAGGLFGAAGALAALVGARATGAGAHVRTNLFDAVTGLGCLPGAEARAGAAPVRATMPLAGAAPCYNIYETADGGRISLGALEPKFWLGFCTAVGRPEWGERAFDPGLRADVAALFRSRPLSDWAALAAAEDVCLEPVRTLAEAVRERDGFQPVAFDGERPESLGPAPARGAHTWQLLREAGLSEQEIGALAAEATIQGNEG